MKKLGILAAAGVFGLGIATGHAVAETPTAVAASEEVSELKITDLKVGNGAEAESRKQVVVHYTGWLYDPGAPGKRGKKFDSSLDRGQPFTFPLGLGRVISGWDEGVIGMRVGGKRTLIIPSEMGYGRRGAGRDIPPNAALVFDVELLEVK